MKLKQSIAIGFAALPLMLSACGTDSDTDTTAINQDFLAISQQVLPVIQNGQGGAQLLQTKAASGSCPEASNWICHAHANHQGHMALRLFVLFADNALDPANTYIDTDVAHTKLGWGVENMKSNLEIFAGMSSGLTNPAPTTLTDTVEGTDATAITSPRSVYTPEETIIGFAAFDLLDTVTYRYHRTADIQETATGESWATLHLAWKQDASLSNVIMGMNMLDNTEKSVGVGQYNASTQDLIMFKATHTTESDGITPSFHLLMKVTGNDATHSFILNRFGKTPGGFKALIAATGISQGAGEFYLVRESHWDGADDAPVPAPTYICISAEATMDHFETAYNGGGAFTDVPGYITSRADAPPVGWCGGSDYETTLEGIPFYSNDDLPTVPTAYNSDFLS